MRPPSFVLLWTPPFLFPVKGTDFAMSKNNPKIEKKVTKEKDNLKNEDNSKNEDELKNKDNPKL